MKKRISILALTLIATTLVAVPLLQAGPHGRGAHGGIGGRGMGMGLFGKLHHVKEELDLTDRQVDDLKAIFRALHDQNEPYREQMKGGLHDVAATLLANPSDITGAQAQLDRQAAAERAIKQNVLLATSKALSVLTAEQRSKLGTLLAERREHGRRR